MKKAVGKRVTDIYLIGFVDINDGIAQFCPDRRWVYIECEDDILIEFDASAADCKLMIREAEEIRYPFDCDEDMYRARASVIDTVLVSSWLQDNVIESMEFAGRTDIGGAIQCDAARITLKNDQCIFLDPTFPYGIGIGGSEQESYWKYCNRHIE